MFVEFINQYGMDILYTVVMAIAGYIGIVIKNLATKYLNDKTKRDVAKTAVQFVEQVYICQILSLYLPQHNTSSSRCICSCNIVVTSI